MIYNKLITSFIKVGLFSIGGAYSAIPLIREIVVENNWMNLDLYTDLVALAESTPGPLMLNIATYVGARVGGLFGSILTSIVTVIPSYVIMLIFFKYFKNYISNNKVQYVFSIVRPTVCAIIFSVGIQLFLRNIIFELNIINFSNAIKIINDNYIDIIKKIIILVLILIAKKIYLIIKHKKIDSIRLIIISAIIGIIVYIK